MTINQIKYVLGVADCGSLNKASEKLYISQPSLTSAVHELEYEIGFQIFSRSARGVTVTELGKPFIEDARALYENYESFVKKYTGKEKKTFGVSTLYYAFARTAFVELVKRFSPDGYDFSFREMKGKQIIDDVADGRSELGIMYLSDGNRTETQKLLEARQLIFHHLTECNAFVYLYKNHPLAEKSCISLDELSDFQFVTYDKSELAAFFSKEVLERRELTQAITVADRSTVLSLLKSLNGYTFLSGIIGEENDGEYIPIPLKNIDEDFTRTFELGYITKKAVHMNNIALTYIDNIRRILHIAGFTC
ncbi:MAG: LysR family transcriptional regulator [Treponema sp.]|nr:LysR family transcriptional regulator [Treponema sp.]